MNWLRYPSNAVNKDLIYRLSQLDYKLDDSGVLMAYPASAGIQGFQYVANEIGCQRGLKPLHLMVNIVPPGVKAPVHTDKIKYEPVERWHLAVISNPDAKWWDEDDGERHLEINHWHGPIPHFRNHTIWNNGPSSRLHIVVDLQVANGIETQGPY